MATNVELQKKYNNETYDFNGSKVLVVDDNKLNLKVAEKLLKNLNINVTLTESGFNCLELINAREHYDLILMDDMMPRMRGTETLNKLKENPIFKIPVVALTANATTGVKEKYIKEGFNDYLGKPIEKQELIQILSKYLTKNDVDVEKDDTNLTNNSTSKVEILEINHPIITDESIENNNAFGNKKNILIVDDNKINIKVAAHVMKPYGFVIDEVYSGNECIEKVKTKKYDLIFMDYMMPKMDGIETLNNLKQLPNFNTPVIALTADSVAGARERFLSAGFNEYISKPLNKQIFDDIINKIFDNNKSNTITTQSFKSNIEYLKQNNIDVEQSIEILGDMEIYDETLKSFITTVQERVLKLNKFISNNDMNNYAVEMCSLKSDAKYLGFTKLADLSFEHEIKSKANDIEFIRSTYKELILELTNIVNIIKNYLLKH